MNCGSASSSWKMTPVVAPGTVPSTATPSTGSRRDRGEGGAGARRDVRRGHCNAVFASVKSASPLPDRLNLSSWLPSIKNMRKTRRARVSSHLATADIDDAAVTCRLKIGRLEQVSAVAAALRRGEEVGRVADLRGHLGVGAVPGSGFDRDAAVGFDGDVALDVVGNKQDVAAAPARGIGLDVDRAGLLGGFVDAVRGRRVGLARSIREQAVAVRVEFGVGGAAVPPSPPSPKRRTWWPTSALTSAPGAFKVARQNLAADDQAVGKVRAVFIGCGYGDGRTVRVIGIGVVADVVAHDEAVGDVTGCDQYVAAIAAAIGVAVGSIAQEVVVSSLVRTVLVLAWKLPDPPSRRRRIRRKCARRGR